MKIETFLYGSEPRSGFKWIHTISQKKNIILKIKSSIYENSRREFEDGNITRKFGIFQGIQEGYIYRIENANPDEERRGNQFLWGIYIDKTNYKYCFINLSLLLTYFYCLSYDNILKQELDIKNDLKEFLMNNFNMQVQKLRLQIESYLVDNTEWEHIIITEKKDGTFEFDILNKRIPPCKRGLLSKIHNALLEKKTYE